MLYYFLPPTKESNFKIIASGQHGTIWHEPLAGDAVRITETASTEALPQNARRIHKERYTELLNQIRTAVTPVSLELYQSLLT